MAKYPDATKLSITALPEPSLMPIWYEYEIPDHKGGVIQKTDHPNPEERGKVIRIEGKPPKDIRPEHMDQIRRRTKALREDLQRQKLDN